MTREWLGRKEVWKKSAIQFLDYSGIARVMSPLLSGNGVIFAGHRVIGDHEVTLLPGNAVTIVQLIDMVDCVRRCGWDFVSLEECRERLLSKKAGKFACMTFDDGFQDNLTKAYEVLNARSVPMAVFPVTAFLKRETIPSQELLEWLILKRDRLTLEDEYGAFVVRSIASLFEKQTAFMELMRKVWQADKDFEISLRRAVVSEGLSLDQFMNETFLSTSEVSKCGNLSGVEIGSHCRTHRALARLSVNEVEDELNNSKREIAKLVGKAPIAIAYPFGSPRECGQREFGIARECGYEIGLTTTQGNINPKHAQDLLSLPRVTVSMVPHARTASFIRTSLYGLRNALTRAL